MLVVDDAIKLAHALLIRMVTCGLFCCLLCGVLASVKLLPSPNEAVADILPQRLLFGL